MNFSSEQRLVITEAIIKLSDPSGSLGLAEKRSRWNNIFKDNGMVFYENEHHVL